MIKKLFILVFLALPLGLAAQNLKFGTVNTVDVFNLMPEKATAEKQLEDLSKQYESEFMKMQEEFTTKYKDFVNSQDSMPENIKQRRISCIRLCLIFHAREYQTTPYAGNTGNTTTYSEFP